MAHVETYETSPMGCFYTLKSIKTVKNLGWLFKHASEVTEIHFKQNKQEDGQTFGYKLEAILNCGARRYVVYNFASRQVFADVFNRSKNLRDVAVFFDNDEVQGCGNLTGTPTTTWEVISYDVWGNSKDGYEVNDSFRTGLHVELEEIMSDRQIAKELIKIGYLNNKALKRLESDNNVMCETSIYLRDCRTWEPICELRKVD